MVIKKPYAFLIKNFRLIHAVLFALVTYLGIKTFAIYDFFESYASTHYFVNSGDLAAQYINFTMFGVIIGVILVSALVFFILSLKNKSRKFYIFLILYQIILFVFLLYDFSVLQDLQTSTMAIESVRAIRDVNLIVLLPQIVFIFMLAGRAIGFNIKQFDFKKDLEELEIDSKDYEEVEITLGKNNYKIARALRKTLRLTKYFILENKFFVTIVASVVVLVTTLVIFTNMRVYSVEYNENEEILASTMWYTAQKSYITDADIHGNKIKDGKYYVLVRTKISNKSSYDYILTRDTFRLDIAGKEIVPTFTYSDKFIDIGEAFAPGEVKSGESKDYVVIFEIEENEVYNQYVFKIKNFEDSSIAKIENSYKDIIIKPYDLNSKNDTGSYNIPITLNFEKTVLFNSKATINSYEIADSFKEKYQKCSDILGECYESIYLIKSEKSGKSNIAIMKLQSTFTLDETLYLSKFINYPVDFYKYYAKLKYKAYGVTKTTSLTPIKSEFNKSKYSYFEVPKEVEDAQKIELILSIRGIKYTIILK